MKAIAIRNLKLYFRDKTGVFFSLMAIFIVIGLYALFLGDIWMEDIEGIKGGEALMSSWLSAGILVVASFTTTLGAFASMVEDKTRKLNKDFYASPLPRRSIAGGYVINAWVVGMVMCLAALVMAQGYLLWMDAGWMSARTLIHVLIILILSTLANTAMLCLLVCFLNTHNGFTAASTMIGTLVGFLTGIYLPVGSLPESVQWVIKLFPPSHAGALLRQTIMAPALETSFAGAPQVVIDSFQKQVGIVFYFGDHLVTPQESAAILLVTTVVFLLLSAWKMGKMEH